MKDVLQGFIQEHLGSVLRSLVNAVLAAQSTLEMRYIENLPLELFFGTISQLQKTKILQGTILILSNLPKELSD